MSKIKLLTSISALLLVFSLGACHVEDDSTVNTDPVVEEDENEDNTTSESTTSEETTNEESTSEESSNSETTESETSSSSNSNDDDSSEQENDPYESYLNDPKEVITEIYKNNNYHMQLKYETLTTKEAYRMSYDDYWNNYQESQSILANNIESVSTIIYDVYYTKDYIWMSELKYADISEEDEDELWDYVSTGYQQVYYNEGNKCYTYTTYDNGETWSTSSKNYKWQDFINSLAYAYELQVQNYFTYAGVGTDSNGETFDWYNISATIREEYLFECIGTNFIYSTPKDMAAKYTYYLTGFYYEKQRMDIKYYYGDVFFDATDDEEVTEDTLVYYKEDELTATIYDIDSTTDNGYSLSIHSMMQNG